jgi:2-oxoglutarate dehydrogenase E2 component (dihydrolipoamide succinyltransferase)
MSSVWPESFTHTDPEKSCRIPKSSCADGRKYFEGTLTKWLKKPGDKVERDEALFEISTDKIDSEIPSPASGILQEVLVKEGQTVQINTVVAVIGDGSAKPAPTEENKPALLSEKQQPVQEPV